MKKQSIAIAFGIVLTAGCAQVSGLLSTSDNVTLTLKPEVVGSGYATQATPHLWVTGDIATMDVRLYTMPGEVFVANKVFTGVPGTVTFSNLHHNTNYRIKAFAYNAGTKISVDASSSVDIGVLLDNAPTMATLKCKLEDINFQGGGTSNVNITESQYAYPQGEAIN